MGSPQAELFRRSSKRVEKAIGCIITINEYIGKTDFELEEIHIGLGGNPFARQISSQNRKRTQWSLHALASVVRDEIVQNQVAKIRRPDDERTRRSQRHWQEGSDDGQRKSAPTSSMQSRSTTESSQSSPPNPATWLPRREKQHSAIRGGDRVRGRYDEEGRPSNRVHGTETVPPMVCQPRDWVLDDDRLAVGGYLTKAMRERMNIVPRESITTVSGWDEYLKSKRLRIINLAQKTEFKVNERMLEFDQVAVQDDQRLV